MKKQWIVNHEDELKQVAAEFIEAANGKRGVGKPLLLSHFVPI